MLDGHLPTVKEALGPQGILRDCENRWIVLHLYFGPALETAGRMARSNEISGGGEQARTVVSCLGSAKSDVWTGFSQA